MRGRRLWLFVSIAVAAAAVFVRLGIWQLHRREERRARNALVLSRLNLPVGDVGSLPRDTSAVRFRRVRVTGTPDYQHELVYAARSYRGSPGVNLLTPVRMPGSDTAVLVNRGWVYAPDGASVDLGKWHDRDSTFSGYVEELPSSRGSAYSDRPNVIGRLGYDAVSKALPYPVAPFYVVALGDSAIAPDRLARLTIPPLDEGPHLNYAIQWFGFALVALAGAGFVIRQARDEKPTAARPLGAPDVPAGRS
ncbi:MAG TPA: SURF1 family protein [Gemmatimonadaceae bacterium]|nr:SURF1 family protein [Gemmatimonadaceae bacterium]